MRVLTSKNDDVGGMIRNLWDTVGKIPGGKILFSKAIGRFARYSGSINSTVQLLKHGHARVELKERAAVRNHLRSVHAMALANLAEITSGLGVMYSLPAKTRGILLKFEIEYLKKARGTLVAEAVFDPPANNNRQDFLVTVQIRNTNDEIVAKACATWRIGPSEKD